MRVHGVRKATAVGHCVAREEISQGKETDPRIPTPVLYTMLQKIHTFLLSDELMNCVSKKKHSTFFSYNAPVFWPFLIIFLPLETGMNTVQSSYKMFNFALTVSTYSVKSVVFNFYKKSSSVHLF